MQFNKGIVGVLVVVMSLIAAVILGVVTNVESQTVNKDVEEYVADITGGFTADKEKSYTDYNPSKNYNGYTNTTVTNQYPVLYESAGYTNNYPISHRLDQITSTNLTAPSDFATTPTAYTAQIFYPGWDYTFRTYEAYSSNSNPDTLLYSETTYAVCASTYRDEYGGPISYTLPLRSILDECISEGTSLLGVSPEVIQIDIPATVMVKDIEYPYNYDIATMTGYYLSNNIWFIPSSDPPQGGVGRWYNNSTIRALGEDSAFNTNVLYSPEDNVCTISINGTPMYTGDPSNYKIVYGVPVATIKLTRETTPWGRQNGYEDSVWRSTENLGIDSPHFSVTYISDTITDFIDTRYGIGIRDSEEVIWNNEQQNGITSIAFSVWDETHKAFADTGNYSNTGVIRYYGTTSTDTFTISRSSGRTYVSLNGGSAIDLGIWTQVQLDIDNINGVLRAYPITPWNNFNNYSLEGTSVEIGTIMKNSLSSITWTANNSFRLQVTNTTVFFNTYGVVMINPYITITDLWPQYTRFMISLTKVATIGDAITLGNSTFPITDGAITVNGVNLPIPDIKLIYEKTDNDTWLITLSTEKDSTQITESNTTISLTGTWYFNAGFYDIVTKQVKENIWNPIYDWFAGNLFFWMAGFTLVGGILAWKLGYTDPLSILILIASEVILIIIGGAT